jgi:transposase
MCESFVLGVSGTAILQALAQGETDPERLANRAHASVQRKHEQLVHALDGHLEQQEQFLLQELLGLISAMERSLVHVEQQIEERLHPFEDCLGHLEQITWVSRKVVYVVFAKVGCIGSLGHLFGKNHCKCERAYLHWLQIDVQLR